MTQLLPDDGTPGVQRTPAMWDFTPVEGLSPATCEAARAFTEKLRAAGLQAEEIFPVGELGEVSWTIRGSTPDRFLAIGLNDEGRWETISGMAAEPEGWVIGSPAGAEEVVSYAAEWAA